MLKTVPPVPLGYHTDGRWNEFPNMPLILSMVLILVSLYQGFHIKVIPHVLYSSTPRSQQGLPKGPCIAVGAAGRYPCFYRASVTEGSLLCLAISA